MCAIGDIANAPIRETVMRSLTAGPPLQPKMFKLIPTMRRGSASNIAAAWARYPTIEAARDGIATLLKDDRVVRVMVVRNAIPTTFVEWVER
jgi:hypothetical protein